VHISKGRFLADELTPPPRPQPPPSGTSNKDGSKTTTITTPAGGSVTLTQGPGSKLLNVTASAGKPLPSGTKGDQAAPVGTPGPTPNLTSPSGTKGDQPQPTLNSTQNSTMSPPTQGPAQVSGPASGTPSGVVSEDPLPTPVRKIPPGDPDPYLPFQRRPMRGVDGVLQQPAQPSGH